MTESELYCLGMESDIAHKYMQELCAVFGYQYPPRLEPQDTAKRDALPDPFSTTTKHSHETHSSSIC